jgi:thiamine pyrophosphate-dependent acetolactate synthase large subunit-like protein
MRDREGFQEVDFSAMFGPLAKLVLRIDDAARIPEYVARAYSVAMNGRPGPVVVALPEDMLCDVVEAVDRPRVEDIWQASSASRLAALEQLLQDAKAPVAIIGGAGWTAEAGKDFQAFAEKWGIPVAGAFRRQDAISNGSAVWAGNLGYGPNPRLVARIKAADLILAVGARLGEATTDGYTLITPDHPGQLLVHVHPDPDEFNHVYRTDLSICCGMEQFAAHALANVVPDQRRRVRVTDPLPFASGAEAHAQWREWNTPAPYDTPVDLGMCIKDMLKLVSADNIICNGAGNFSGWWHRYWPYASPNGQLAPTAGAMGYGVPAAVAAALRCPEKDVIAIAGDGDFLMNAIWLRHARAGDRQRHLRHDPHASGARISHPRVGHDAPQSGFRSLGPCLWGVGRDGRDDRSVCASNQGRDGPQGVAAVAPENGSRADFSGDDNFGIAQQIGSIPRPLGGIEGLARHRISEVVRDTEVARLAVGFDPGRAHLDWGRFGMRARFIEGREQR